MKQTLRNRVKRKPVPRGASLAIQQRLIAQDWWACTFQAGLYLATPEEPRTDVLMEDLRKQGALIAVPSRHKKAYIWARVDADTRWLKGSHGIREPSPAPKVPAKDLRVIVVPGVAFDAQGGRLGHGRGHFDRLLADSPALLVGLCFENRLVDEVPMASHDVRMDIVMTEKQIFFAPTAAAKLERLIG